MSVTITVVSQMSLTVLFCFSAEGPSPTVNKKISFNISCLSHLQVIEFDDGSGSVLRIQPLRTPRDEAIYECVASNRVGETRATTRLTVLRGRSFSTAPKEKKKKNTHTTNMPFFSKLTEVSSYLLVCMSVLSSFLCFSLSVKPN